MAGMVGHFISRGCQHLIQMHGFERRGPGRHHVVGMRSLPRLWAALRQEMPGNEESRFRGGVKGVGGHYCHPLSPTRAFHLTLPLAKDLGLLRACSGPAPSQDSRYTSHDIALQGLTGSWWRDHTYVSHSDAIPSVTAEARRSAGGRGWQRLIPLRPIVPDPDQFTAYGRASFT